MCGWGGVLIAFQRLVGLSMERVGLFLLLDDELRCDEDVIGRIVIASRHERKNSSMNEVKH